MRELADFELNLVSGGADNEQEKHTQKDDDNGSTALDQIVVEAKKGNVFTVVASVYSDGPTILANFGDKLLHDAVNAAVNYTTDVYNSYMPTPGNEANPQLRGSQNPPGWGGDVQQP